MPMLELFNLSSEVNAIYSIFAWELRLFIKPTDVKAQKINGITLDIFEMVVAAFLMTDKANWVKFLEKTFLVANVSLEVVLGCFFSP